MAYLDVSHYLNYLLKMKTLEKGSFIKRKVLCSFPSSNADRYTQCRQYGIHRHIGMDADIQAMDGNLMVTHVPGFVPAHRLPSLSSKQTAGRKPKPPPRCGVTYPRIDDLLHGRVSRFSLDALVNIATAIGRRVHIELEAA